MSFEPGTLWHRITEVTARAIHDGALLSIPTSFEIVEDGGVQFLIRVVANLARKHDTPDGEPLREGPRQNPFLPHEPALYVADASPTHVCVLNKFNVVEHHLLIVTRRFERQESPVTLADFQALWLCLAEYESLGFYNGGTVAGASQPHKHLQLTPLPIAPGGERTAIDSLIASSDIARPFGHCVQLPFRHAVAKFDPGIVDSPAKAARRSFELYGPMMHAVGCPLPKETEGPTTGPYNLLITRRWMMIVPRIEECFEGISLNALAFTGALLVKNQRQMERLRGSGPMTALCHAAGTREQTD